MPNWYERDREFQTISQTEIKSPSRLLLNIDDNRYILNEEVILDITDTDCWDSGVYISGAERAGKDFYIYAVAQEDNTPKLLLSANSTVPTGYTATNSRKIGGFHCLCVNAGTNISDHGNIHPLSGYLAGDILPCSVWDLKHRPVSEPEGMVYVEGINLWVDIYLSSYTGSYNNNPEDLKVHSRFGAVIADGTSAEKFHCYKAEQVLGRQKKRLLHQYEFVCSSIGSNQSTNIQGSSDPNTTGGHVDTAGRRMISNFGLEDCCGAIWQWGLDVGSAANSSWGDGGYDGNDKYVGGRAYGPSAPYRVLFSGGWSDGVGCGSRSSSWGSGALALAGFLAFRAGAVDINN